MTQNKGFTDISSLLSKYTKAEDNKYISREFQQYGYELATELGDIKHIALYIKIAKESPRAWIESARSFVKDADNARSKARLFMWKLKEIKKLKEAKTG